MTQAPADMDIYQIRHGFRQLRSVSVRKVAI